MNPEQEKQFLINDLEKNNDDKEVLEGVKNDVEILGHADVIEAADNAIADLESNLGEAEKTIEASTQTIESAGGNVEQLKGFTRGIEEKMDDVVEQAEEEIREVTKEKLVEHQEMLTNPNKIGELINFSKDIPTDPDKVYRSVSNKDAIDDLMSSGVVRNAQSAGIIGNSRWDKAVFWSKGEEGKYHITQKDGYVIEAPLSVAEERLVTKEDVTAIYTKNDKGDVLNIIETKNNQDTGLKHSEVSEREAGREEQNNINFRDKKNEELTEKLSPILEDDISEKYKEEIDGIRQDKIDWANSTELARRLRGKGANEEEILQVRDWLVNNATEAKTFIFKPDKYKEFIDVVHEMTGEDTIKEGAAIHIPGNRNDVPDIIKNSIILKENISKPPIPGQDDSLDKKINITELSHEFGHVTQDGLLQSELYHDWAPQFKEGASDKEYVGLIHETDTRIRSMYRDLGEIFNPEKEVFGKKHLEILIEKRKKGQINKDTEDLLDHYSYQDIVRMANRMPAI